MYALSQGRGSFCRPALSGSPCPPLAAARVGGRARFAPRGVPPALAPRLRVVAAPSPRKGSCCGLCPPLRSLCGSPLRLAPSLAPRGAPGRCGASSRPSALGSRSLRAGAPVPPCPAPLRGVRALSLHRGGFRARLRRASLCARAPPRSLVWWCRRCGGGASAPFCFAAGESFGFFPSRSPRSERRSAPRFIEQLVICIRYAALTTIHSG